MSGGRGPPAVPVVTGGSDERGVVSAGRCACQSGLPVSGGNVPGDGDANRAVSGGADATMGAGVVCGIWWRHALADRFLDPMRAGLCMLVLQGLAMVVNGAPSPQLFFDAPLLVSFAALVGFDGEMRRTGGFDVK